MRQGGTIQRAGQREASLQSPMLRSLGRLVAIGLDQRGNARARQAPFIHRLSFGNINTRSSIQGAASCNSPFIMIRNSKLHHNFVHHTKYRNTDQVCVESWKRVLGGGLTSGAAEAQNCRRQANAVALIVENGGTQCRHCSGRGPGASTEVQNNEKGRATLSNTFNSTPRFHRVIISASLIGHQTRNVQEQCDHLS